MNQAPQSSLATTRLLWFAIFTGAALCLAVLAVVRASYPSVGEPQLGPMVWVALAVAASGLIASRGLARRALAPDPVERRRWMLVQTSVCELGALLGGVAWLLSGDPWSWVAAGLGMLGIVLAFPRAPAGGPSYVAR